LIHIITRGKEDSKDIPLDHHDLIYNSLKDVYARRVLTWVVFIAAIVEALLANYEFVKYYNHYQSTYSRNIVGIYNQITIIIANRCFFKVQLNGNQP